MAKTAEELLEEAKKMIGMETEPVEALYPVEYDAIRRYCYMVDYDNPLFLDPEYAKKTKHGEVVCPPLFVHQFGGRGIWPPSEIPSLPRPEALGTQAINLTTENEFFKTVKVGDRISVKQRFADVYIKSIRLDPKAFWMVNETIFTNQDGDVVAIWRNISLSHRTPEEVKAAGDA